ncbi:hypothetical protein ACEWY4_010283 [Coilia grayii]|uniref:Uncharacterized protein n=1 Tax=Coilia grayii TaxID=363190 RepID=A0ABD1K1N0_9TELE
METLPLSKEALVCPLCCEVFRYPVTLQCGHSACKPCLQKFWDRKGSLECPICRRLEVTMRPPINLALKIAADRFQQQQSAMVSGRLEERCTTHNERLKLFCQRDELPICLVCQVSKEHRNHECCSIADAAIDRKVRHFCLILILLSSYCMFFVLFFVFYPLLQIQADETETLIREEFEKLHSFLREQEASRLAALREEEEQKAKRIRWKLEDISKQVEELSAIIRDADATMKGSDIQFLKVFECVLMSCPPAAYRLRYTKQEPEILTEALIDTSQFLGSLKYGIWRKMAGIVHHCPLYLDPNTAQANLILSDELTSVHYGKKRSVPSNHERCSSRMAVLTVAGFMSGKHSWDVDVGDSTNWYIGVARESIDRKNTVFLHPAEGFWVISLCNSDTYWAQTSPRTRLAVRAKPRRITVELDYDKGKVTFLNAVDGSIMYMFKEKFAEKIFPFFSPGIYEGKNNPSPLKICPLKSSILSY